MLAELSAAVSSIKATSDIVKGIGSAVSEVKLNEIKLDLQRALLEAREALSDAQAVEAATAARIRELEQEIVRLKDWSVERQRYQLCDVGRGGFAYLLRTGMENGEPAHWLCATCFNQGRKSLMQSKGNGVGNRSAAERGLDVTFACDTCKGSFQAPWNVNPASYAKKQAIGTLGPSERCDKCGADELRLQREEADPVFGELGGRRQFLKCTKCAFETERIK